jgi:hypothetical protein
MVQENASLSTDQMHWLMRAHEEAQTVERHASALAQSPRGKPSPFKASAAALARGAGTMDMAKSNHRRLSS